MFKLSGARSQWSFGSAGDQMLQLPPGFVLDSLSLNGPNGTGGLRLIVFVSS